MSYLVICAVALLASTLTFYSGFGLGTLLLPAFALFVPVEQAVALTAVVHLLNSLFKLLPPIWACPPAPRHAPLRSDSIYSRQSEEPKTGCQREPTAPLALSSSERRDPAHFARLRPLRRPSRPKQHRDFHQTERRLTSHRSGDIAQARKKGGLKFLYRL